MRKITIFIILAFLVGLCAAPAYANNGIPTIPHAFCGSVTINGSAAADGTQVSATVDNGTVIPTQNPVATAGGNYGIGSLRLLVQGDITPGANITFYVNGYEATPSEAASFESGGGPDRIDLSVTIAAPTPPPAGGGGGGPILPAGTTDVRGMIGTGCRFYTSATANSEDRICRLTIPPGTVGLTEELACLTEITMLIMDEPPPPPKGAHVIGLAYDFQPSGATFEPPITLTFSYDPGDIPEGIAEEDLVLAYYDQKAGKWVNLECTVDTDRNTITALISHFTGFAIVGYEVIEPAAFTSGSLVISPTEVDICDTVNVSLSVANTGGMAGSYKVILKVNGAVEATQEVTVGAGASEEVTFTVSRCKAGSYSVDVNGLSGSFTVKEKPAPPPAPPPPAPPEVKPPINFPLIGGLIAAAVIAGLLFFLIRRRRRAL